MSRETIDGIENAIRAHLADIEDGLLTDWFVAYASMSHEPDADDGISHGVHYATSPSSPHGALGIATLGINSLTYDLSDDDED